MTDIILTIIIITISTNQSGDRIRAKDEADGRRSVPRAGGGASEYLQTPGLQPYPHLGYQSSNFKSVACESAPGRSDRLEKLVGRVGQSDQAQNHARGRRQHRKLFLGHLLPPRPEQNGIR